VLEGAHFKVRLVQPLWHVLAWLCNSKAPLTEPVDLARDWFNVRAPTSPQVRLPQVVLNGFLFGHREWMLWQFVGRATRKSIELSDLAAWRSDLAKRYPAIERFHNTISQFFWHDAGAHREHDDDEHRLFLDCELLKLLEVVSVLTAQAVEGVCVARFQDWMLCAGSKPKAVPTAERIEAKLAAAFTGANFSVNIEALQ
jgi:hypothetical protein